MEIKLNSNLYINSLFENFVDYKSYLQRDGGKPYKEMKS